MSLVTRSTKRNREYPRAFDHEKAQALRAAGGTYGEIADRCGVSAQAVRRVCDPAVRDQVNKLSRRWMWENKREPCKGGCGVMVWAQEGRTGYCTPCLARWRVSDDVRDGELRCTKCGEWKPDDEFYSAKRKTRRGRHSRCRSCDAAARRAHRAANREQERSSSAETTEPDAV